MRQWMHLFVIANNVYRMHQKIMVYFEVLFLSQFVE